MLYSHLSLIFSLLLLNVCVAAQDTTLMMQEITIKENRIETKLKEANRTIEIIPLSTIQNAPARNVAELLSYVSGVDMRHRGVGGAQVDMNIRGGTFDQALILIDGIALSDPQTGHHLMNLPLSISDIQHIEIHKSGGARIFGQNAFAGAINIITKKPGSNKGFELESSYESFETFQIRGAGNIASSTLPARISVQHQSSGGYRPNTDYKISNVFLQNRIVASEQIRFDLMAGYNTRKFGGSGFYAGPAPSFAALPVDNNTQEYEEVSTVFASVSVPISIQNFSVNPRYYFRQSVDDYYFTRGQAIFNSTKSNVHTFDVNSGFVTNLGQTGIGFLYQYTDFSSLRLDTTTRRQIAFFAEHKYTWNQLDINAGIQYSHYSDFGGAVYPGIEAGYRFSDNLKLYGSWNQAFRIPTFTDLYFKNGANNNNPDLQPEKADNYELGARWTKGSYMISGSWFSRVGADIIDRIKTDVTQKWTPMNLSNLSVSGVETTLNYQTVDNDHFIQKINLSGTFLYQVKYKTPQEVVLSRYAADNLRYQFSLNTDFRLWSKMGLSLNTRYFERFTLVKNYESYYKGIVADSRIYWRENKFLVYFQTNNLTDKKYVESNGITMPGRWMAIGMNVRF